jgi:alanine racemase
MATINQPTISPDEIVRPTLVEVDLNRLASNFQAIQQHVSPAKVMPILKANAYGHGLLRVAQLMESLGADYLGVAVLEEGILLRENGIRMPILVLGGILGNQVPGFLKHDLTINASSIDKLEQVDEIASQMGVKAKVHLKVDTGMERIGVHYYNAEGFLEAAMRCRSLVIEGIYSHFANADMADLSDARRQLERFQEVLAYFDKHGLLPPPLRHMANSPAILQLPESRFDLVRPGLLLYGVYPTQQIPHTVAVLPALSWKSRVVYFKVILPGHPVGYGSAWQTDHLVRAVTVPVGYGDGYFRGMSGKARVLLRGKRYPVVGRISMDQVVVNIEWDSAYNDDEVVLVGESGSESITVEELAEWAGTIPYEVLTNINTRVPRVYLGG